MGKPMYHIKAKNESYSGYRNRAGMTLRFEHGEAATSDRRVAEYWHKQPGYTCIELTGGHTPPAEAPAQPEPASVDAPDPVQPETPPAAGKGKKKTEDVGK